MQVTKISVQEQNTFEIYNHNFKVFFQLHGAYFYD